MDNWLPIITIVEYILTLFCGGMSTYFFAMVIYWNIFKNITLKINLSMKLYILIEFIFSFWTTMFSLYFAVYWRPNENVYNAYVIFFTAAPLTILLVTEPVVACYLGVERCLCLLFPFKNTKLCSLMITILTVATCGIFTALILPFHVLTGWPAKAETSCRSFGCMQTGSGQIYSILRYTTSILSVFIGLLLFWLFKKRINKNFSIKNTRLVVITLIAAILFDFIPHLISFSLITFAEINLTKLIGPYSTLVSAFNSFVCGFSYYKAIKLSMKATVIVPSTNFLSTTQSVPPPYPWEMQLPNNL